MKLALRISLGLALLALAATVALIWIRPANRGDRLVMSEGAQKSRLAGIGASDAGASPEGESGEIAEGMATEDRASHGRVSKWDELSVAEGGSVAGVPLVEGNLLPKVLTDSEWSSLSPMHRGMLGRLADSGDDSGNGGEVDAVDGGGGGDEGQATAASPWICFVPGASDSLVRAMGHLSQAGRSALDGEFQAQASQLSSRWSETATNPEARGKPNPLIQGDPMTLTWSIIPDGTAIAGGANGAGEPSSPSNLVAWLNGLYGSEADWLPIFQGVFDRWEELTGVRYVYEPSDDGASFPFTDGSLGDRGDVRIGGHFIDGPSGVLAYNYYPTNGGNMVIDTADTYLESTASNSLRLRNTVAHEHGHGLGLRHVCPVQQNKLMEPYLNTSFDGPQHDEIYSAQRLYGDAFEDTNTDAVSDDNDSLGNALSLGTLAPGIASFGDLSIDDIGDQDYYAVTPSGGGFELSVTLAPVGASYLEGGQNSDGSCSAGLTFDSRIILDVGFEVIDSGGDVLESRDVGGVGSIELLSNLVLPAGGGTFYVRVFGSGQNNAQLYDLELALTDPAAIPEVTVFGASADEAAGAVSFTVQLSATSSVATSVGYSTAGGSAVAGVDYTETSGTLNIPAGSTTGNIDVIIEEDALDEDDEQFTLTLASPVGVTIANGVAIGTVLDDDLAPGLSVDDPESAETGGTAHFEVTLSAVSGRLVEVDYATSAGSAAAGSDFTALSGTLSIPAGAAGGGIDIVLNDDDEAEIDEAFGLTLSAPSNAVLDDPSGTALIFDDDALELLASTGSFDSSSTGGAVTINWQAVPGRQYTILYSPDLISWAPLPGAELITATSSGESFFHDSAPIERGFYRIVEGYVAVP